MDTGKQLNANELIAKLQELEKENARLRKILDVHGIPYIVTEPNVTTKESLQAIFHTDSKLSLQEKVALFRSVFQGRDDVFAKRWYSSTTNKSGYQPVIENGTENFVTSESTNVRIVPTGNSLLLHTTTFSIILQERMHGDVML
jgi:hypothetical protein